MARMVDINRDDLGAQIEIVFSHDYEQGMTSPHTIFGRVFGFSYLVDDDGGTRSEIVVHVGHQNLTVDMDDPSLIEVRVNGEQRLGDWEFNNQP